MNNAEDLLNPETQLLSLHFSLCGSVNGFRSYTWFVPIKWNKKGGAEQQYWLLDKEGKLLQVQQSAAKRMEHNIRMFFCIHPHSFKRRYDAWCY